MRAEFPRFSAEAVQGDPGADLAPFLFPPSATPACSHAIAAWMDADHRLRILLSQAGEIQWANDAAHRAFRDPSGLRSINNRLTADGELSNTMLARVLAEATADGPSYAILACGAQRWLIWVKLLVAGDQAIIGLAAHRMAEPVSYDTMLRLHRLTPCEARIISLMLAGHETGRIAQQQDISIETLRTHIKHAYRKLDVKSRGELFAKAVDFVSL